MTPLEWYLVNLILPLTIGPLMLIVPYLAFQKHLLPVCIGRYVGRLYFFPCLPFTVLSNRVTQKKRWWAHVDDEHPAVLFGEGPFVFTGRVSELSGLGVGAVVNLCDEWRGPTRAYTKLGITQLHVPVVDHCEPSVSQLQEAVAWIQERRESGLSVYIHCKSGRGRSAALAMCYLLSLKKNIGLEEAQQMLSQRRKVRGSLFQQPNITRWYQDLDGSQFISPTAMTTQVDHTRLPLSSNPEEVIVECPKQVDVPESGSTRLDKTGRPLVSKRV